jgi:hypothetical protein
MMEKFHYFSNRCPNEQLPESPAFRHALLFVLSLKAAMLTILQTVAVKPTSAFPTTVMALLTV